MFLYVKIFQLQAYIGKIKKQQNMAFFIVIQYGFEILFMMNFTRNLNKILIFILCKKYKISKKTRI